MAVPVSYFIPRPLTTISCVLRRRDQSPYNYHSIAASGMLMPALPGRKQSDHSLTSWATAAITSRILQKCVSIRNLVHDKLMSILIVVNNRHVPSVEIIQSAFVGRKEFVWGLELELEGLRASRS